MEMQDITAGAAWPEPEAAPIEEIEPEPIKWAADGELPEMTDEQMRGWPELAGMVAAWDEGLATRRNQIGERFTPLQLDRIAELRARAVAIIAESAAPEPVQDAPEPVASATPAPEPVEALSEPENEPERQIETEPDPIADIMRRLAALEAAIAATAPLSAKSVETPTEAIQRPRRTPAHERAVRRAWRERCERIARADLDRRALLKVNGDNRLLLEQLQHAEASRREAHDEAAEMAKAWIQATTARRRTVKLAIEQRKRRQQAEFAAEARAAETAAVSRELDAARWEIERIGAKRRRNALFARKRTREMVAAVNHMHDRLDAATQRAQVAEAALAKLKADLADPSEPERASDIARLVRERDEARTANAALQDRCQRVEAARDQLAEAVENMAGRLARAEAAVRRLEVAA